MSQEYRDDEEEREPEEETNENLEEVIGEEAGEAGKKDNPFMTLQLGDIIEIIAPSNDLLHENTFFIEYIDDLRIALIDVASLDQTQLNKDPDTGDFTDLSIKEIILLSRSEVSGYARQNKLIPGTWIEIHIGGDISTIITGEITSLEEDQIEITTIPELDVIYIDFEYKGLPKHIPIKKIVIRDKPSAYSSVDSLGSIPPENIPIPGDKPEPKIEYLETGESIIHAEEDAEEEENVIELLRAEIAKSKELVFGEDLEDIEQFVELPESKRRYGLDLQTASMLDELLSTIPATKRTKEIMAKIHTLIAHYRELRNQFSLFDNNGEVRSHLRNNPQLHKPIIERIKNQDTKIDWILPVVSLTKKVYTQDDEEGDESPQGDIISISIDDTIDQEENLKKTTYYNDRTFADESKYYKLYKQLDDFMRPFENPTVATAMENQSGFLNKDEVRTNLEAIIDNYDEFYSSVKSVSKQADIVKRQYVIQRYDLGLNKRTIQRRGEREIIETSPLTRADSMFVKSMVLLPAPVVQWSRVKLPETSILEKSNLHQFSFLLFRILKKNTNIAPFIIEDLEKDIYENEQEGKAGDKGSDVDFLDTLRHYVLSDTLQRVDEDDKFDKFLRAMIPKTKTLIRLVRKYITQKLSFVSVVQSLEPFSIYSSDISYKQYLEIRRFIMEQIEAKKEMIETKRKDYGTLTTHKFQVDTRALSVIQYLLERPELLDQLIVGYQLPDRELIQKGGSTSEVIKRILDTDNGVLLTELIQNLLSALKMPTSLAELLEPIDADVDDEEKVKSADCHTRVLAKKYTSLAELQKDNGKETFFDREYDKTPYNLLSKYKDQQNAMPADKFSRFLAENLVQKHEAPKDSAAELAEIIIRGKRAVKEGEFALLYVEPEIVETDKPETVEERRRLRDAAALHAKSTYYYRKNDIWVHHREMDDEAFMGTADLFCNVKKDCLYQSGPTGDQCSSRDDITRQMRETTNKRIRGEFDKRFELADEDMKAVLHNKIATHLRYLQRLIRIQTIQRERPNNVAYQIGLEATKYTDAVFSPYVELRDRILGQSDFVKKQHDILRLYDKFCREPMELLTEDNGWKYCKKTNTKLLPAFLYELASTYVHGGDYALKLDEICHTHGLLSDSGDAIVDKHSGFAMRAIDFAEEDGYDEAGFKITTHAFLQKGEVDKAVENIMNLYSNTDEKQVCEGERAQMICNILGGIAKQIGHPLAEIRDLCVRIASTLCDKMIDTEEKYNREAKKMEEKKGVKLPPYKKSSQRLVVLISAAVLFMAIQTEMPTFQTKKTMPGCVRSFKGYPLSGEEDTSGLLYFACVLSKMEKKMEPWNALERMTAAMIQEQMKKIAQVALKTAEMDDRYLKKREFNVVNAAEIPEEHALERWGHFLPPLIPITSPVPDSVSADFKDALISAMKKGSKHQQKDLLALQSKIAQFGFSIVSNIQKIVKDKELLLVASSTGTPFLQNVCCNDKTVNPLIYFTEENSEIGRASKSAASLSILSRTLREVSKPAFLFDPRSRPLSYPPIPADITEANIYAAFIHYCQLDRGTGVPAKFHSFFTDVPVGWPGKSASLDEKIEFLKRHDKRFSPAQFAELLQIIHKENIVTLAEVPPYHRSEVLKDLILLYDNYESPVIDKELRENIYRVLNKYDKSKLVSMNTAAAESGSDKIPDPEKQKIAALKLLKDSLAEMIQDTFKPYVLSFLKKYGKMGPADFNRLNDFFQTFVGKWATPDIYKTANFVKNTVYEMTSVFPNILITNVTNVSRVHNYWQLADVDEERIEKSVAAYFEPLGQFRKDRVLQRLLLHTQDKFVDLRLFFENLPIQEAIRVGSRDYYSFFDMDTVHLLLEYIFLSVLHEYIIATDKLDLIQMDQVDSKRKNREKIAANNDPDTLITSEHPDLLEEYREVYGDMLEVQIEAGNREDLKTRVAKMLLAFIKVTRKNKSDIDISYENIAASVRKRKEKEKNRIVERFKNMSEDERKVEDMKKKLKMDEWNVGTQSGIFKYDIRISTREVLEQQTEEELDIQKHGIRQADFLEINADTIGQMDFEGEDVYGAEGEEEEENMLSGLGGLKRNFHDGQFYSDDESDDDFGDEA